MAGCAVNAPTSPAADSCVGKSRGKRWWSWMPAKAAWTIEAAASASEGRMGRRTVAGERTELQIVGGGRMGEALLGGLLAGGRSAESLAVAEVAPARREELAETYPGVIVAEAPVAAPDALLAVKPGDVPAAAAAVAAAGAERALSVAAGVTTAAIEEDAGGPLRV